MFVRASFILFVPLAFIFSSACQSPADSADVQVKETVRAEQAATSERAWELDENHPTIVMSQWRANAGRSSADAAAPCRALRRADGRALLTFEDQIRDDQNANLLEDCKPELIQKITQVRDEELASWLDLGYLNPFDDVDQKSAPKAPKAPKKDRTQRAPRPRPIDAQVKLNLPQDLPQFHPVVDERELKQGWNLFKGDLKPKQVQLTFDDGPSSAVTPRVLAALKAFNAKALFFECGKNIQRYPEYTQMVAAEGHGIGNHSWNHLYMGKLEACTTESCRSNWINAEQGFKEFYDTHQLLKKINGWVYPFIRFPYGATTPELTSVMKKAPVGMFFWSADSNDWKMSLTNEQVMQNALRELRQNNGGIVLFHDVHARTADLLPEFLRQLHQEGYELAFIQPKDKSLLTDHPWIKDVASQKKTLPLRTSP